MLFGCHGQVVLIDFKLSARRGDKAVDQETLAVNTVYAKLFWRKSCVWVELGCEGFQGIGEMGVVESIDNMNAGVAR